MPNDLVCMDPAYSAISSMFTPTPEAPTADASGDACVMPAGGASAAGTYQSSDVEVCKRIADIPLNPGLEHWWLRTPDFESGMGPAGGGVPGQGGSDSPYVSQTTINDHTGEGDANGAYCVPAASMNPLWTTEDKACLQGEATLGRDTGTWTPWNQCHSVVEDMLDKCAVPTYADPNGPDASAGAPGPSEPQRACIPSPEDLLDAGTQ